MDFRTRVDRFDECFGRLIDLISPKYYFSDQQELTEELELDKRAIFEEEAEVRSKKTLHQKVKLNSDLNKNVSDVIDEKCEKKVKKKKKLNEAEENSDPWGRKMKLNVKKKAVERDNKLINLKLKLKTKIDELKKHRKADELAKGKTKRESKKERREKNRSNPGEKQKGFIKKAIIENDSSDVKSEVSVSDAPKIYNKEGKLIFSKFDFVAPPLVNGVEKKKHKSNVNKLKSSLNQIKKEKETIQKLESEGKLEEATSLKKNKMWRNAVSRSEGEKVKDNEKLIEKSLKRKKKLKQKHASKWKDRVETVNKKMEERQERRKKNLKHRQEMRKESKIKKSKKKGRVVFND